MAALALLRCGLNPRFRDACAGMPGCAAPRNPLYTTYVREQKCIFLEMHGSRHMATKQKQGAALGRKVTTAATNETGGAEQTAKTAKKTSAGSATRKSGKMTSFDEQTIQARAYLIWIEEGRPEGRDVEHWLRACAELDGEAA